MASSARKQKKPSSTNWRQLGLRRWRRLIERSLSASGQQRVITQRAPTTFVEQLEPRYLLSADLLALPPQPEREQESVINLQHQAEAALTDDLEQTEYHAEAVISELLFVDPAVTDHVELIEQALGHRANDPAAAGVEVVYLDAHADGVEQITQWLGQYENLQAIHVVSHGASASLQLGSSVLDASTIDGYAEQLRSWSTALAEGADLLFYGCEVAQGEAGKAFVDQIGHLTGADVAASKTLIGSDLLGGNWTLEYATGPIEAFSFFHLDLDYGHVLGEPDYTDGDLTAHIDTLRDIFTEMGKVGAQLDTLGALGVQLPMVDVSLARLLMTEDGRTLGDILSFAYFKDGTWTTVLDDFIASGGNTYGALMVRIGDYLHGRNDYEHLVRLIPTDVGDAPFAIGGGIVDGQLQFHLNLELTREFLFAAALGDRLEQIGFGWGEGEGLPLVANIQVEMAHSATGLSYTNFSVSASQQDAEFSTTALLGAVPITLQGEMAFESGAVTIQVVNDNGEYIVTGDNSGAEVIAWLDVAINGTLFDKALSEIAGGVPRISMDWRDAGDAAVPWSLIGEINPEIELTHLAPLSALSAIGPNELLNMFSDLLFYLENLRDSKTFDGTLPFTDINVGMGLDFTQGLARLLNDDLQAVQQSIVASDSISPVLERDLSFDITFQRPGESRPQVATVIVRALGTQGFTHIEQLAAHVEGAIAEAANGLFTLYARNSEGLLVAGSSAISVTAQNLERQSDNTFHGSLVFSQTVPGTFEVLRITPSAGINLEQLQTAVSGEEPRPAMHRLQLVHVGDSEQGGGGSFTLSFRFDGQDYTTAAIDLDTPGAISERIAQAINAAMGKDGTTGVSVVVSASNSQAPTPGALNQGIQSFDIIVGGTEVVGKAFVNLKADPSELLSTPGVQAHVTTLRDGTLAVADRPALAEVQRLSFDLIAGGNLRLAMQIGGQLHVSQAVNWVGISAAALETAVLQVLRQAMPGLADDAVRVVEIEAGSQYDVHFEGELLGNNMPQLRINATGLTPAQVTATAGAAGFSNLTGLGFGLNGASQQLAIKPNFTTWAELATHLEQMLDASMADRFAELEATDFALNPRFDLATNSVLFDLILGSGVRIDAAALVVGSDGELSGLSTQGQLDITHEAYFKATFGFDLRQTNRISIQAGGAPLAVMPVSFVAPEQVQTIAFDLVVDGKVYSGEDGARLISHEVGTEASLAAVITALNNQLNAIGTTAGDSLARRGFANLGQAIHFIEEDGDVKLRVIASVGEIRFVSDGDPFAGVLLGIPSLIVPFPDPAGRLPADGRLSSDATFELIIDNGAAVSVTVTAASTSNNNDVFDLIADIQAALNAVNISNHAWLGSGGLGHDNLGDLIRATFISDQVDTPWAPANGALAGFLELQVTDPSVSRIQVLITDESSPGSRELGLSPGQSAKAVSSGMFVIDAMVGGRFSGEIHGQAGSAAKTAFPDTIFDTSASAVLGLLNVSFDTLRIDEGKYQGSFTYVIGSDIETRYDLNRLVDSTLPQGMQLGFANDFTVRAGGAVTLPFTPFDQSGEIIRDVGLAITLTQGSEIIDLGVSLRDADTRDNSTVADLAEDLNEAIRAALDAWATETDTINPYTAHTFVVADTSKSQHRLRFEAPAGVSMKVANRLLMDEYSGGLTWSDLDAELRLDGVSVAVLDGMSQPLVTGEVVLRLHDLEKVLLGQGAQAVELVGQPDFGDLEGLASNNWSQLLEELTELPQLLGNLANMGEFQLFNQALPVLSKTLNDLLGLHSEFSRVVGALHTFQEIGLLELQQTFEAAFGTEIGAVAVQHDTTRQALLLDVPFSVTIERMEQLRLLLADPQLTALMPREQRELLESLLSEAQTLADAEGMTLLPLIGQVDFSIRLGIDLARDVGGEANPNLGRLFLADHQAAGDPGIGDDVGTFATFHLKLDTRGMLFSEVSAPHEADDAAREIHLDARDFSKESLVLIQVGGEIVVQAVVAAGSTPQIVAAALASALGDHATASDGTVSIVAEQGWGNAAINLWVFSTLEAAPASTVNGNAITLHGDDIAPGRVIELVFDAGPVRYMIGSNDTVEQVAERLAQQIDGASADGQTITFGGGMVAIRLYELHGRSPLPAGGGLNFVSDLGIASVAVNGGKVDLALAGHLKLNASQDSSEGRFYLDEFRVVRELASALTSQPSVQSEDGNATLSIVDTLPFAFDGLVVYTDSSAERIEITGRASITTEHSLTIDAADLQPGRLVALTLNDGRVLYQLVGSTPSSEQIAQGFAAQLTRLLRNSPNLLKNGLFEVAVDGHAEAILPVSLRLSDQMADLVREAVPEFKNPMPLGTLEAVYNSLAKVLLAKAGGDITLVQQISQAARPSAGALFGVGDVAPDGAPVDTADESGLPGLNPKPWNDATGGEGQSTTPSTGTTVPEMPGGNAPTQQPARIAGVDVQIIAPNLTEWVELVREILLSVTGPDCDPQNPRPTNGPLLFLLSDPATVLEAVDTVFGTLEKGLEAIVGAITAPIIGSGLSDAIKFVADLRKGLFDALNSVIEQAQFQYGAIDNAFRMAMFDMFHHPDNPFLNFLRDYNGDGQITPDDIVVEYVAPDTSERQLRIDSTLSNQLLPEQLWAILQLADSGQRLAWVASGKREPKTDDHGNLLFMDAGGQIYVLVNGEYRQGHHEGEVVHFTEEEIEALGYCFEGVAGDVVLDLDFQDLLEGFWVTGDSSGDFEIVDEEEDSARWITFSDQQKEAARGIALSQASALQYRMNLGQTIPLPTLNAAFDVGVPGLNLQIDGGIGVTLDWDFYLGFGIDLYQGFYMIADMPGHAGIGQLTEFGEDWLATGIKDADVERDPHTGAPILDDDGEQISLDPHIGNLWEVDDDDLQANIQFQVHAFLEGSQSEFFMKPIRDEYGNKIGEEIAHYDDLFMTDEDGNYVRDNDGNLIPLPVQAPAELSAELLFLRGTVTDNFSGWIKDNEGRIWGDRDAWQADTEHGPWSANYDTFAAWGGEELFDGKTGHEGSRTQFLARFEINLTDNTSLGLGSDIFGDIDFFDGADGLFDDLFHSSDGRITRSVLQSNDFDDLWVSNWEAWAQINLHIDIGLSLDVFGGGLSSSGFALPSIKGDFHLTWSASKEDPDQPEWQAWLERFQEMGGDDYGTLFVDEPGVWITDITFDMGNFFSKFVSPILDVVQVVTGPFQPIIDEITRPIPGISDIMRKNYSIVDMAVDFSKLSGGNAKVDFIVTMINLIDTINSISQLDSSIQIPVMESLILAGNPHAAFGLDDIMKYVGAATDFLTPNINVPGETTITLDQGMSDFFAALDEPANALSFPIIENPVDSVLGLLLGQPIDLMTFTPPDLQIGVGVRQAFPIFGPLFVGLRGEISIEAQITLGFDTYGVIKAFETGNAVHVMDGFYISDNVVNGVDQPEITLNATLAAFAELNAVIARGGVEGGIEFIGELDLCDPDQDGRVRMSEIASLISSGNTFITMEMYANAFVRAYVELLALFTYVRVFEQTFMNIELFRWSVGNCDLDPILASRDGTVLTLHAGSSFGGVDGYDAISKNAADRERRSTDDGDEHFIIRGNAGGTITIEAILPDGQTYEQEYASSTLVRGYTGIGDDIFDASELSGVPVYFVAGSGINTLIASNAAGNVLIGGSEGTTTLIGGTGNDLLIARGGTTIMQGGESSDDTYRFLTNWGKATVSDNGGANIIDFSTQTLGVTISDAGRFAMQGVNRVEWGASTVDLIRGGSGEDHIDFSGNSQNLTVTLTDTNQGWVTNSRTGMAQSDLPTNGNSGQSNSGHGYSFESIEHITGGRGSDVVRVQDGASISGSLRMATGNDLANARNTLDFSEFTTGVSIDLLGSSSFGSSSGVMVRGFHNVFGGSGNDILIGNGQNNLLVGNGGRDQLSAVGGHNLLVADNFNTYLNGSSGPGVVVSDYVSLQQAGIAGGHGGDGRMWLWKGKTIESRDVGSRTNQSLRGSGGNDILLGGLGNDTIISGEGSNTILGDLGRVMVDFNFNVPLFVESFGSAGGGNDTIRLGTGNNIVVGGGGNDTITAQDTAQSFNIVLADNGTIAFRASGGTFATNALGHRMLDYVIAPENENGGSGGHNTVHMGSGSAIIFGGAGHDVITMHAATSTAQNTRYIAGDHAELRTDANGGVNLFRSLSTSNGTGGDDFIAIGDGADSHLRHLGSNYIIGGVGSDTILTSAHMDGDNLIRGEAESVDVIIGDVGQIRWWDSSAENQTPNRLYQVVGGYVGGDELEHDRRNLGGSNTIHTGNGDRYIIGGYGGDTITAAVVSNDETGDAVRVIAGDHARIDFDGFGNMVMFRSLDTETGTGGDDYIRIGSGFDSTVRNLGTNFIIGGMGSDTILISAHFNQDGQLIQGQATSEDVIIGANGLIERTHATANRPNLMLRVETIEDDKGGDDRIHAAHGGKVILGGFGSDVISALDGIHLVFGDSARLVYDNVANNGVLRLAESKSTVLGGHDQITLGDGYKLVGGGIGGDIITIHATTTPEAIGIAWDTADGGFLAGVTGIAAVAYTSGGLLPGVTPAQERGRSGRFIAGDNVRATFDSQGGLTNLVTLDQIAATGGADTIVVGAPNTTANLGLNVLFGGMGADVIRVQPGSYAENVIFGDNGQFNRQPLNYAMQSLLSTQTSAGGSNTIRTGSGDNIIIGGFAGDIIRVDSSSSRAGQETNGYNRAIVLGDSGEIRFSGGNLERIDSIAHSSGGNDHVTIGDGDVVFVGGHGGDTLHVDSNETAFRVAVGDNAALRFAPIADPRDQAASLIRLTTLDQVSATGGNDTMRIGVTGVSSGDMGEVIVAGGVGSDDIRISGGIARATLLGDNGQIERVAGWYTGNGSSGQRISVTSLNHTLGGGGTIHTAGGDYVILGGSGGDQIRAGKGSGLVFGDHGQVLYENGVLSSISSVGITQGGDDTIELGVGTHFDAQGNPVVDGRQIVVGGYGADHISLSSNRGTAENPIERAIAGDNVTMAFDSQGRLTDFTTLDSSISTGGNDTILVNMAGERDGDGITDYNVIAGGMGNANINVQGQTRSSNVISGDNLDYRRLIIDGQRQHLSATVPEPTVGGNDTIRVGAGDHILFGGAGSDTVTANTEAGDTTILFGDVGNVLFDNGGNGRLQQLLTIADESGGGDTLNVGRGDLYLFAGAGGDSVRVTGDDEDATRIIAGWGAQVNFDSTGAPELVQSRGPTSAPAGSADNHFNLNSTGTNFVLGGAGFTTLIGSEGDQHRFLPGSGSINLQTRVVSVVVLGDDGDLGINFGGEYATGLPDANGFYAMRPGSDFVRAPLPPVDPGDPVDPEEPGEPGDFTYYGIGTVVEDSQNRVSGRIAYPALEGGLATFNPQSNSQQGGYGYLTMREDGAWYYDLGFGPNGLDESTNTRVQALRDGDVRTEYFSVTTRDGSTTTITITVQGRSDTPNDSLGAVSEDGVLEATGTVADPLDESGRTRFESKVAEGEYGQLVLNADGSWHYTLHNDSEAVQQLRGGQQVVEAFVATTLDGGTATIAITVTGNNDAASISGQFVGSVIEHATDGAAVLTASGQIQVHDIDAGEDRPRSEVIASEGVLGSLTIDAQGHWQYSVLNSDIWHLHVGETLEEHFTITSWDGTASETIIITVHGVDNPPQVGGSFTGQVAEDGVQSASGQLTIFDPDAGQSHFVAGQFSGAYGSLSLSETGQWQFQLNPDSRALRDLNRGETALQPFTIRTADGTPVTLTIEVLGASGVQQAAESAGALSIGALSTELTEALPDSDEVHYPEPSSEFSALFASTGATQEMPKPSVLGTRLPEFQTSEEPLRTAASPAASGELPMSGEPPTAINGPLYPAGLFPSSTLPEQDDDGKQVTDGEAESEPSRFDDLPNVGAVLEDGVPEQVMSEESSVGEEDNTGDDDESDEQAEIQVLELQAIAQAAALATRPGRISWGWLS